MDVSAPTSAKALAREKVKGLWIAIPTPFTADGRHVDEDTLAASGQSTCCVSTRWPATGSS